MKILITGTAGFIGYHCANFFSTKKIEVVGIDNINEYYDTSLKLDRLKDSGINLDNSTSGVMTQSMRFTNYRFIKIDLEDDKSLKELFSTEKFDLVLHLAAQAGVRYSLENPKSYIKSNIEGFLNILECCRQFNVKKLIYASSSSVYGLSKKTDLSIEDRVDNPISLYAATKKSNELMAHSYSHLFPIQTIGVRFFTVYGPWGRPDMAPFIFANSICNNTPINVFNYGNMKRDFTFIDDIVMGLFHLTSTNLDGNYHLFNMGNSKPVQLIDFIENLEVEFGKSAFKNLVGMQPGDVIETCADVTELYLAIGYKPKTDINTGVKNFVSWFKNYYKV